MIAERALLTRSTQRKATGSAAPGNVKNPPSLGATSGSLTGAGLLRHAERPVDCLNSILHVQPAGIIRLFSGYLIGNDGTEA